MDCRMCSICRTSPSRISVVFAVIVTLLVLSPMRVSSKQFKEQGCRPRPTVVPVKKAGFEPYHIELHRCSGTCVTEKKLPPTHWPCKATSSNAITLDLIDLTTGKPDTVTVYNHTHCGCVCEVQCDIKEGEFPDEDSCVCITPPKVGQSGGKNNTESTLGVLPYQIGIGVIGIFALCVLIFDMAMCSKEKGVLYKVKEKCCKRDQVDNKDVHLTNGKICSRKENSSPEEQV